MDTASISLHLEKVTEDQAETLYLHLSDPILSEYLEDEIPTLTELKHSK
ncbi:MAG: hypothetical protein RM347_035600 [Nostoc sp. ChiQUE02]|nr:hypothetical protein [Nostoc sp. ChiQUE02]MDZ8232816.1 hypothetical protein [Nostoc sp. ChiQUE02]